MTRMILGLVAPSPGGVRVESFDLGHRRGRVVVQFAPRSVHPSATRGYAGVTRRRSRKSTEKIYFDFGCDLGCVCGCVGVVVDGLVAGFDALGAGVGVVGVPEGAGCAGGVAGCAGFAPAPGAPDGGAFSGR